VCTRRNRRAPFLDILLRRNPRRPVMVAGLAAVGGSPAAATTPNDVAALAELLRETSVQHDDFDAAAAPDEWWDWYDWYAAYMNARQRGCDVGRAITAAGRYVAPHSTVTGPPRGRDRLAAGRLAAEA
jgi:hypothetical protein